MKRFTVGFLVIFLVLAADICNAQETDYSFRKRQDSAAAIQYANSLLTTTNSKPFYYSGIKTKKNSPKNLVPANLISNITTSCFDTSQRSFIINDTLFFYTRDPYRTADGKILLSGQFQLSNPPYNNTGGFLAKMDEKGNVLWHRTYKWQNLNGYSYINYYRVMELQDGTIFLAGSTGNPITGNDDIIFTKTDMQGEIIWSKIYKSRLWGPGNGSASYYYVQQMKQDLANGDIYLTGPTWSKGRTMMKLNSVNGNIFWGKSYEGAGNFDNPIGLAIKTDKLLLFSKCLTYSGTSSIISITELSKATGDTISCRYWKSSDPAGINVDFLNSDPLQILNNGHYILTGRSYGSYIYPPGSTDYYHASVVELDSSLNFVKAYNFRNSIESNTYNTRVSSHSDGGIFFTMLYYISGYTADVYTVQLRNGYIAKQRKKHTVVGIPYEPKALQSSGDGDLIIRLIGDTTDVEKIELLNLHASDTSSSCLGIDDNSTYLYHFNVIPTQHFTGPILSDVFEETTNRTIVSSNISDFNMPGCLQLSSCDSFKLSPSSTVLCPSQTLQITGKKNAACGSNIIWQYNTLGISSASQPNDSTLMLNFNGSWSGYIYGSVSSCSLISDSVFITVFLTPQSINLGPDFTLCPQNTRLLNAHSGFVSYTWQDGSSDSTFLVTQPGTYYVAATDACGVTLYDTVRVYAHAPVLVSVGPDRAKCNNDTLILHGPSGFISYNWSPNYNINGINMQSAVVNPAVDTFYILTAELEPGCYGFDTVKITVYHSPPIDLGNDTSFCKGTSITLSAGAGFVNHLWNTGSLNTQITVGQPGIYSVIGTTVQGCKSKDTMQVLEVYNNPTVTLDQNDKLCQGSLKTLDAGIYASYLWQNGATTQTITVNGTGIYYVTVTDNNGCRGTGTSQINTILPLPKSFLPDDRSKCNYEKIIVQPNQAYYTYLWSDNSTGSSITITKPGLYWLAATDQNKCTGRDSITITQLQCLKGLFVPNAFTPNGDGNNDVLKALLFGEIKKFEFMIYNRYGQLVFSTSNVNLGWNGMYEGVKQETGAFVWRCQYQLEGDEIKGEAGTFMLLR